MSCICWLLHDDKITKIENDKSLNVKIAKLITEISWLKVFSCIASYIA